MEEVAKPEAYHDTEQNPIRGGTLYRYAWERVDEIIVTESHPSRIDSIWYAQNFLGSRIPIELENAKFLRPISEEDAVSLVEEKRRKLEKVLRTDLIFI